MLVEMDGLLIVVRQSESFFDGQVEGDHELRLRTISYGRHGVEVVMADKGGNVVHPLKGGLISNDRWRED
jgi:signal transduction histidine kinase